MSGYFVKASQQFQMPRSNSIKLRSDLLVFSTGLCLPSPILDRAHAADGEQTVTFFRDRGAVRNPNEDVSRNTIGTGKTIQDPRYRGLNMDFLNCTAFLSSKCYIDRGPCLNFLELNCLTVN